MNASTSYSEALQWLYSTQNFGIKLGLDAPKKLLRQSLATPSSGTKVIHVAGTNGKGSTCAIIEALARATGLRCGLFTSPHLVNYRERIRVNGEMISEKETLRHLLSIKEGVSNWQHHPTFFEITLTVAMRHFKERECELIILETGMGGRLDATTAVPADVCVITPIAMDHSEWLGDTLEKIAFEKSGIICQEKPVISAKQEPEATAAITEIADAQCAPLTFIDTPLTGYSIQLAGTHQAENAHLALEAITALGIRLDYDTVKHALAHIQWDGRFETVSTTPHIVLDGAHNEHAARALVATWNQQFQEQKATLIFGAAEEKDISSVLHILCTIAEEIHLTPIDSPRSLNPESLRKHLPENTPNIHEHTSLQECLQALAQHPSPILITGSLFLVGETKSILENESFQRSSQ